MILQSSPGYFHWFIILLTIILLGTKLYFGFYWSKQYKFLHCRMFYLWMKVLLRFVVIMLLLFASLSPIYPVQQRKTDVLAHRIYILLDISNSMRATDLAPTRMERAIYLLQQVIDNVVANYTLILFSKEAFVYCPQTSDRQAFKELYLNQVDYNLSSSGSTHIASAFALAAEKIEHQYRQDDLYSIVCVSDWESPWLPEARLIQRLQKNNIRLHHLVVGTTQGSWLTINQDTIRNAKGQAVLSRAEIYNAKKIAQMHANAKVYIANNQLDESEKLIRELLTEQKQKLIAIEASSEQDIYYLLLICALLLLLADAVWRPKIFVLQ